MGTRHAAISPTLIWTAHHSNFRTLQQGGDMPDYMRDTYGYVERIPIRGKPWRACYYSTGPSAEDTMEHFDTREEAESWLMCCVRLTR